MEWILAALSGAPAPLGVRTGRHAHIRKNPAPLAGTGHNGFGSVEASRVECRSLACGYACFDYLVCHRRIRLGAGL